MLNTIIIEDERPALEALVDTLTSISTEVNITARLSSVKEGIDYLSGPSEADLIISDVQLSDGLSFEIFNQTTVGTPVIFITGYDQFMMNAFDYNGIDYLLKPVDREELRKALAKYHMLEKHFNVHQSIKKLSNYIGEHKRKRIVVKKGIENILLRLDDTVLFYTENKIVYVVDRWGKKYLTDKKLSELETELDNTVFFRANRQYIININFIRGFKPYEKVKLCLDFTMAEINHVIIISQETAPQFREWMHNA
jgi:DNA-binding LytR/AlgR family response regulator